MPASLGVVFVALAVIFLGVALGSHLRERGEMTIAQKTWLRVAFIFSAIAIVLFVVNTVVD